MGGILISPEVTKETLRRLNREEMDKVITVGPPKTIVLKGHGHFVIEEALAQLKLEIKEPTRLLKNGADAIDGYIRRTGLEWQTADAITWKKFAAYVRNGMFQWCGAFAAHCYAAAGLKLELRRFFFPSATRLFDKGPRGAWAGSEDGRRLVQYTVGFKDDVQEGDLLVMGYVRGGKPVPSHIGLAYKKHPPGQVVTIEGNARGHRYGWDSNHFETDWDKPYEGVVMQLRKINPGEGEYGILRVIRPIEEDYEK